MESNKTRFILIRNLTAEDNRMLEEVKNDTGYRQASKALLQTGHAYLRLRVINGLQKTKIAALEAENRKLRQSAAAIAEAVGNIESVIKNGVPPLR